VLNFVQLENSKVLPQELISHYVMLAAQIVNFALMPLIVHYALETKSLLLIYVILHAQYINGGIQQNQEEQDVKLVQLMELIVLNVLLLTAQSVLKENIS